MAVELIAFDLDGTLVDSLQGMNIALNHALKELGVEEEKNILKHAGVPLEEVMEKFLPEGKKQLLEKALELYREKYKTAGPENSPPYPGAIETLEKFREEEIKLAVATTKRTWMAKLVAEGAGIAEFFDLVLGEDSVANPKPAPDIVLKAMEELGSGKEETVFVGDMVYDIEAAKSAGVTSVWASYGYGRGERAEKAGPDYVINSFSELEKIISKL